MTSFGRPGALIVLFVLHAGCGAEGAAADPKSGAATPTSASATSVMKATSQPASPPANAALPVTASGAEAASASAATSPPAAIEATPAPVKPDRDWAEVRSPLAGTPRSIGGYSAGCVAGAEALPVEGDGYLVRRPGRLRHYGHPQLVDFVRTLGAALVRQQLGAVVIGDLGQPRGGPAPDGHASHQTGLDADIWYPLVQTEPGIPKAARARRALKPLPVANFVKQELTEHWTPRVARVLRIAAEDARVNRIFVNPMIKRALCRSEQERGWLRKLRPWWGHDAHFHVRLSCPPDSPSCEPQPALAEGDACDGVEWWFSKEAAAERDEERAKYRAKVGPGDLLPAECNAVLAAVDQ